MQLVLFDDSRWEHLLPLTFTRPVSMLRVGITTIKEKWEHSLGQSASFHTIDYLKPKFPGPSANKPTLMVNGGVIPSVELVKLVKGLKECEALVWGSTVVAAYIPTSPTPEFDPRPERFSNHKVLPDRPMEVYYPWDIFRINGDVLALDYETITRRRESQPISTTNRVINPANIFIEEGATVECATLNAQSGPIYIARDAEVMEGSIVRGPFALGEHSALKLGAKIYGPTTIGPHSKVGGEVNNSVIQGYSSKAHDGFLGNSVIGEWCNLGADTNTSNLKNNYAMVKLWSYAAKRFVDTGLQFCGLVMGDHSKCGINTMFNTGTVVGVSANIFGDGFPRNFIPSFSWGGAQGFTDYRIDKALETARIVFARRGLELSQVESDLITHIYGLTSTNRRK